MIFSKKGLVLDKLRVLADILPNNFDRADEIVKDLDALIEKYK